MNWLAHLFLSEEHIAYQHGNLLADLLKGRAWSQDWDRLIFHTTHIRIAE